MMTEYLSVWARPWSHASAHLVITDTRGLQVLVLYVSHFTDEQIKAKRFVKELSIEA